MADKTFQLKATLTADGDSTDQFVSSGGPVLFSVQCNSGTGDVKLQKSLDDGTTFKDLSLAKFTGLSTSSDIQERSLDSNEGDRYRINVANSASTPSFVVKVGHRTIKNIGNRT